MDGDEADYLPPLSATARPADINEKFSKSFSEKATPGEIVTYVTSSGDELLIAHHDETSRTAAEEQGFVNALRLFGRF